MPSPTVSLATLGCKLNFAETAAISQSLKAEGYDIVPYPGPADYFVINTCSVTDNADKKCKKLVDEIQRTSPASKTVVIGCYAQLNPAVISTFKGVDAVLGAKDKFSLPAFFRSNFSSTVTHQPVPPEIPFIAAASIEERTRAFLKVQDGCNYSCSFCTIPLARGASRNGSIVSIIQQAQRMAELGVKEIILTGVNIGDFGHSSGESFRELLARFEKEVDVTRIRISSIEPNLLTDEIIEMVAKSEKIVPHFHMPLQSGSDRILALMKRRYKRALYRQRVENIKIRMPHCAIGADVITGFPGEGIIDFNETFDFISDTDISYLHVFTYSERANTRAPALPDKVTIPVKKHRSVALRNLSDKKKYVFCEQFIGKEMNVLFERSNNARSMVGFTPNYIKVVVPYQASNINEIQRVILKNPQRAGFMEGEMITHR